MLRFVCFIFAHFFSFLSFPHFFVAQVACTRGIVLAGFAAPANARVAGALRHALSEALRRHSVRHHRTVALFSTRGPSGIAVLLDSAAGAPRALSAALARLAGERIVCAESAGDGAAKPRGAEKQVEAFAFAPFALEAVELGAWLRTQRALGRSAAQRIAALVAHEAEEDAAALDFEDAAAASAAAARAAARAAEARFQWTFGRHALLVEYIDALCDAAGIDDAADLDASLLCSALSLHAPLGAILNRATAKRFAALAACPLRELRERFVILRRVNGAVLSKGVLPLIAAHSMLPQCRALLFRSTQWDLARFILVASTPAATIEILCAAPREGCGASSTMEGASRRASASAQPPRERVETSTQKTEAAERSAEDELLAVWAHAQRVGFGALRAQPTAVVPPRAERPLSALATAAAGVDRCTPAGAPPTALGADVAALRTLLARVASGLLSGGAAASSSGARLLLRTPNTQLHGSAQRGRELWIPRPGANAGIDLVRFNAIGLLMGCALRADACASFAAALPDVAAADAADGADRAAAAATAWAAFAAGAGEAERESVSDKRAVFALRFPSVVWKTLALNSDAIGRADLRAVDDAFVSGVLDLLSSIDAGDGALPAWREYCAQLRGSSNHSSGARRAAEGGEAAAEEEGEAAEAEEDDRSPHERESPRWAATLSDCTRAELIPGGDGMAVRFEVRRFPRALLSTRPRVHALSCLCALPSPLRLRLSARSHSPPPYTTRTRRS